MNDIIQFDDIDELGEQTYSATYDATPADIDRPEVAGTGPMHIDVRVDKGDSAGEYVADGTVNFAADFTCSRCVEPYPFANASSFHVRFRPRPAVSEENEDVEIAAAEDLDVEFYTERSVPLRELALEQVQLSIPMKPLCEENCLGLCSECGANRNREKCSCETSPVDVRWGALSEFREQLARKKDI
jgi:uncharacterized protein